MKQCLRLIVSGKVQGVGYRKFVAKYAEQLHIEGTIQNCDDGTVLLNVCGSSDALDEFIDHLYKGPVKAKIDHVVAEPLLNAKDFRNVFRVLGPER